ncbi:acidic leucine-rich nuclear phosphoprotein 32 family member A [Artemisia annua]|uniref:Acidic leucine-rich nuclear phosphoprotein 32 family member A n=1 Tax=Artemisia annua TaxID=35608 RepID=A0A2U1PWT2_ARTAN|nr:acidic leucine-rich nuclear phosphoprotein 32 family member A [Artemisia annua]
MFYGQLEEILELTYIGNRKVVLFRCKWFDTKNPYRCSDRSKRSYIKQGIKHILTDRDSFKDQQYILATQARQVFYLEDPARRPPHWKVVEDVHHRKIWDRDVVEADQDVIHDGIKPVGKNAAYLSSYIGELVRDIPQDFKSWNKVPAAEKAKIIPNLQRYFDLQSHFRDETLIKVKGENKTKGSVVRGGLERDFADRYSSHKNKFKYKWFTKAGSVQAARQKKPPNWKAGDDEWQKLVDFWADPDRMAQSERNSNNRSKNKYEENKYQEDMVETWRKNHSDNNGHFQTRENERIYILSAALLDLIGIKAEMKAIQDAVNDKKIDPKTDREIVAEVLQSNNRGHIAGVGRVVPGTGSSSRSSQADPSFCTREEFEEMQKKHAMELDEQRKAYESQGNVLKQFVEFFNRQQGTPASQFQIPDLYTPRVFPGSTYDVGGPSSTPSAPSSSLGPENCYIPTFDSGNSRICSKRE